MAIPISFRSTRRNPRTETPDKGNSVHRLIRTLWRKNRFACLLTPLAVLIFVLVHVIWRYTLPVPWSDESHFIIPAIAFYNSHTFTADAMYVHQIFWMPVHLYILNGIAFTVLHAFSLNVSRALAFVLVTAAAIFMRSAVRSILASDSVHPAIGDALIVAWYISLPIVFSADLMRPDALSLCLSTACLSLALKDHYLGAFALAVASGVTHPLEAFPAVAVGICVVPLLNFKRASWSDRVLSVWAFGLLLYESSRVVRYPSLYRAHLALQLGNKAAHHIPGYTYLLIDLTIPLLAYSVFRVYARRRSLELDRRSRYLVTLTYALVSVFVTAFAQEMWYFVWELSGFVLLFALGREWFQSDLWKQTFASYVPIPSFATKPVVIAMAVVSLGISTWAAGYRSRGIYGFYTNPRKLSQIRGDQEVLQKALKEELNASGAKSVLLPPSLYGFFVDCDNSMPNLRFSTLNPFSTVDGESLDHLVVLTRGYPTAATETRVPSPLADQGCSRVSTITTPHGYYQAVVLAVSATVSSNSGLSACRTMRF